MDESSDPELGISGNYLRTTIDGTPVFAVGAEKDATTRIDALVHGIHWCRNRHASAKRLIVVWGSRGDRKDKAILDPVATLLARYRGNLEILPRLGFQAWTPIVPDLSEDGGQWKARLQARLQERLPATLASLARAVGSDSFRWYRTVTDDSWSGRVEGLEVCTVEAAGRDGLLDVGKPGKNGRESRERLAFLGIARERAGAFLLPRDQETVAATLREIVRARESGVLKEGQPEHLLESRVLRGAVKVVVDGIEPLEPVAREVPFQFPTCWTPGGDARFVDALMRHGSTPWVVELKVPTGGQASYYRHAVAQAVLYREFIRTARPLHGWFQTQGLQARECRAAVAVPEFRGPRRDRLLRDLMASAADFDVAVIPLARIGSLAQR
ncbi:hypothetical protein KBD49_10935 [Myxococcota bacterium]|nr:hypothetical protein [Myxococcota bacterium]